MGECIEAVDSQWLHEHLDSCASCRNELASQRLIRNAIAREPRVEFAPQASFNRLWRQIEADSKDDANASTPGANSATAIPANDFPLKVATRQPPTRFGVRIALAAQAAAILVLLGFLWQRTVIDTYRTVTDSPLVRSTALPTVKVIFDDRARLADVKEILSASGLVVAAGPSETGLYTLVPVDSHAQNIVAEALTRLRADPRVRFAEPTTP